MDAASTQDRNSISRVPPPVKLLIGGDTPTRASGGSFTHVNPATGKAQAEIPLGGVAEIDAAVAAAKEAFPAWRATPGAERRELLLRLANLIQENAPEFGRRAALEGGIPIAIGSTFSPEITADWMKYYAGWADKIEGQVISTYPSDDFAYIQPEPYGVIAIITTWNGPLVSLGMKVPAAIAAGNVVVIKPSELAPFSPSLFGELVTRAGFPPGVINIVPGGPEAGQRLIEHPDVAKVSFTGGPATARKVLHACAELLKPTVMELGGKAPNIIFADVDLDAAAAQAVYHSIGVLSGQACAAPTRVIVERSIYNDFLERLVAVTESMILGDPFDETVNVGPLINEAAAIRVKGLIDKAVAGGKMRLMTGGGRAGGALADGYYIEPTVFADVDPHDPLAQNEIFGPVLTVHSFNTEEEAITIANAPPYGLGGYLHTSDVKRAQRVASALNTGNVYINTARTLAAQMPFGGFGISGFGKEGGRLGLEEFLRYKSVGLSR